MSHDCSEIVRLSGGACVCRGPFGYPAPDPGMYHEWYELQRDAFARSRHPQRVRLTWRDGQEAAR